MQGFTTVNSRRRNASKARKDAEAARVLSDTRIPGAQWSNVPLSRAHLPGIPYSYYDEEIVMLRQCTAELIERQRAEARKQARAQAQRRRNVEEVPEGGQWYKLEKGGRVFPETVSYWQGVDE